MRGHDTHYWRVPRQWEGRTIAVLAGGPSLTQEQVDYCRGRAKVIAINNAYQLASWADMLYFCDDRWWKWHQDDAALQSFAGEIVTLENPNLCERFTRIKSVRNYGNDGLSELPDGVKTGANSGYQVINLAVHLGAAKIVLLGYDMAFKGGRSHWHQGHPMNPSENTYQSMLPNFPTLVEPLKKRGVDVINATPGSALECFRKKDLKCALIASSESNRTTEEMHSSPA